MLERTVYISGQSGTGKTTIIRELIESHPDLYIAGNPEKIDRITHVRDKSVKFSSIFDYAVDKINRRFEVAQYHLKLEKENPGKIILGDRCIHDTYSYLLAALTYGDLTKAEVDSLLDYQNKLHPEKLRPKNIVFIDGNLADIMMYLAKRAETEHKGFRDDDQNYLKIVSESFKNHFSTLNDYFYLRTNQDASAKIHAWAKERIK